MQSIRLGRLGLALLASVPALASSSTGCVGPHACQSLRAQLQQELDFWAGCGNDADCVVVGGDPNDCTGVLLCDFAVARGYRSAAAKMVLDNSANRGVCADYCAVPSCPDPTQPVCDAVSHKCVLEMYPLTPSSTPDASTPLPPLPDAGADGP